MKYRALLFPLAFFIFALSATCGREGESPFSSVPRITLRPADGVRPAFVEVLGLSPAELSSVRGARFGVEQWQSLLRVTVDQEPASDPVPAVQGRYDVTGSAISFTPLFPFDPGRAYRVAFNPAALPVTRRMAIVTTTVALPSAAIASSTMVTAVYPESEELPENTLRLYIEFSAPMGNTGALGFVRLVEQGRGEVATPFLPVEADFWNADHTRYTLFFDPGRVKQGILPNEQLGRPLRAGRRYTLEILSGWRDRSNQPLKAGYRREFRVGSPETRPLAPAAWRITPPDAGTRDPLVVAFPHPLDHGLLGRTLSVESDDGRALDGEVDLEAADTRWRFHPRAPWPAGTYRLVVLAVLEDPAGNRIGRAFEADMTRPPHAEPAPDAYRLPFRIVGPGL